MPTDQSAAYKLLFSTREMVRALVQGFVPDDNWLHSLDYATLEKNALQLHQRRHTPRC